MSAPGLEELIPTLPTWCGNNFVLTLHWLAAEKLLAEATDPWRKVSFFRPETKVTEQPLVKPVIALKLCQL
jgi:hypothetical protein